MRIWAKAMKGGKIRKQFVYERDGKVVYSQFFTYLSEICAALDVPTPVLLKTHIFNFAKFNHVNFLPRDFVESVDFDLLNIEAVTEKDKKKHKFFRKALDSFCRL